MAELEPLRQFSFVILLVFIMSPASQFIWDWAVGFEELFGVDLWLAYYGEAIADPELF